MQTISDSTLVELTVPFDFPVYFTAEVFSPDNSDLVEAIARKEPQRCHRLCVILERAVAQAWPDLVTAIARYVDRHQPRLQLAGEPLIIAGGEAAKNNPSAVPDLQAHLDALGMDRHACVVVIGGGALLDTAGYAAATVHRGLRVVRLPTTVQAQADSGVGVKNGINAFGKKNFLGTFAPPFAVLNDRRFLETLSVRDRISGMAEAVKVSLIRDAGFFEWLVQKAPALASYELDAVTLLVRRSAQLHLDHIATSGDPFELGNARPLDFGHWAGHKLEALTHNRLRHGEAVAIGLALDTCYSVQAGLAAPRTLERVVGLLEQLGLRLWEDALDLAATDGRPLILDGLAEFHNHLGGEFTIPLLKEIGQPIDVHEIDQGLMCQALDWLRHRQPLQ